MIRIAALVLALGLGAPGMLYAAGSQNAHPTERPVFGVLSADQISQIQGVGRAVLAAKGSQQSSAEEMALLNELHNLFASVDQALKFTPSAPNLSIATNSAAASTSEQAGNAGSTRQDKLNTQLTPALDRLKQVRQGIDAMSPGNEEIAHVQHLSTQAGLLEQSVRDALSVTNDADRYAQLAQIKQRLRSRTMGELLQDQKEHAKEQAIAANKPYTPPVETPTLTTLTQHRAGLDDLHAGKH